MDKNEVKKLQSFVKNQAKAAQADLDERMEKIQKVCAKGCDACCYQMVSVHTWEEGLISNYIETKMHADVKKQVRAQLMKWWHELRANLRPVSKANPLTLIEVQILTLNMIQRQVMCPFLVNKACSIYPVRPAICRSYVMSSDAERCKTELGRIGEPQGGVNLLATFGPTSPHLPVARYFHAMKPLAFAMTEVFKIPAPSTPMQAITLGELTSVM
ncbi:MAG: YkgJ family cysteine cluster protein [Methylobacter sp.]